MYYDGRRFSVATGKIDANFPVARENFLRGEDGNIVYKEQFMENGTLTVPAERFLKGLVPGEPLPDRAWRISADG